MIKEYKRERRKGKGRKRSGGGIGRKKEGGGFGMN